MLNINTMSLKMWYKYLLEVKVTHTESEDTSVLVPCRAEHLAPVIDWGRSWRGVCVPGLSPEMHFFLWRMLHDILPTQERLHRMEMPNAPSPLCLSCSEGEIDSLEHALLKCSTIRPGTEFLLEALKSEIPDITLKHIRYLDFQSEDLLAPTYLTAATLLQIWSSRTSIRRVSWLSVRANVEQSILTLRKSRFKLAASKVISMWNASSLVPNLDI